MAKYKFQLKEDDEKASDNEISDEEIEKYKDFKSLKNKHDEMTNPLYKILLYKYGNKSIFMVIVILLLLLIILFL